MSASILIIDDQITALENLEAELKEEGYRVFTASDGEEGLRKCGFCKPDVVILDIYMPGMRGDYVAEAIKNNPEICDTPIIFLTSLIDKKDVASYARLWGRYFIAKPYQFEELNALLKKILRGK